MDGTVILFKIDGTVILSQLANRKRDDRQKRREKLAAADLRTENRTSN